MAASMFEGPRRLTSQYAEVLPAALALAINTATAVNVMSFTNATRVAYIDNSMDKDITVALQHFDSTLQTYILTWFEIAALRVMDASMLGSLTTQTSIDAGTKLFLYCRNGVPSTGKLRMLFY